MPRTGQLALLAAFLLPHVAGARVLYANGGAGPPGATGLPGPAGPAANTGTLLSANNTGMPRAFRSGIIPARHLAKFIASATPTVCAMGDSTWAQADYISFSDGLGEKIKQRLREDYPDKTITFKDFSIGGTSLNQWTAVVTGTLPSWYTPTTATWASFPAAAGCTTLFVDFGVNDPSQETAAAFSPVYANIATWAPVPDVILVNNAIANPAAGGVYGTTAGQVGLRSNGALQRTLASSGNNLGATAMPPVGLIDINRYFQMSVNGVDPATQAMSWSMPPTAPVAGITAFPYTFPFTPGGDFDVSISLDNPGSSYVTALTTFSFAVNDPYGGSNYASSLTFSPNGGSTIYANYYYNNGSAQIQGSGPFWNNNASGNAVRVVLRGDRLVTYVNGNVLLDTVAPRGYASFQPKFGFNNPPAAPSMTVKSYAIGTPRQVAPTVNPADCYGSYVATGSSNGNGVNHDASICLNDVYGEALDATTFR